MVHRAIVVLLSFAPAISMAQPSISIDLLPMTTYCIRSFPMLHVNTPRPPSTLKMRNDGWCWFDLSATIKGHLVRPTIKLLNRPAHGEILIEPSPVKDKTRVAYKPDPAFMGSDRFTLLNVETTIERLVEVSIVP